MKHGADLTGRGVSPSVLGEFQALVLSALVMAGSREQRIVFVWGSLECRESVSNVDGVPTTRRQPKTKPAKNTAGPNSPTPPGQPLAVDVEPMT
jgi:hypothetical protein